jgi:streptogramin lyase
MSRRALVVTIAFVASACTTSPVSAPTSPSDPLPPVSPSTSSASASLTPGRDQPEAIRVTVPKPGGVAVTPGAVWVQSGDELWRLSREGRVLHRYAGISDAPGVAYMGFGGAGYVTLAAGFGSLWSLVGGQLLRIDPENGRVLARVDTPNGAGSIAVGEGAVWVACCTSGPSPSVLKIDPETGVVVGRASTGVSIASLAVGPDAVWVLGIGEVPHVERFDPSSLRRLASFDVGSRAALAAGGDWLWVMDRGTTLERVDPSTGRIKDIHVPGLMMGLVAFDNDVFVDAGALFRVSGRNGRVDRLAVLGRPAQANAGIAVDTTGHHVTVWMSEPRGNVVVGIPVDAA